MPRKVNIPFISFDVRWFAPLTFRNIIVEAGYHTVIYSG